MANKILIDMERQRHPNSGLGYYCRCLEQGLEEIKGDTQLAYYRPEKGQEENVEGYKRLHKFFNPKTYGYDLLHITHQLERYFNYSFKTGKYIVTLHDLNFLREQLSASKRRRLFRWCRNNLERADVIVCISEFVRQDFLENKHLFKLKDSVDIRVIHNGIFFESEAKESLQKPFPELENQKFLLSIGVLHHKKQQHRMVEMLAYLPKDLKLVLVYSDKKAGYYKHICRVIEQYGLSDRVVFLSNISNEEKAYLFKNMQALLHPSIAEGFGIPPIEAMAEGKPVFLSQHTSLPEVGGTEAYYFGRGDSSEDLAQTVLQGLQDYEADKEKAQRLKTWAMRYDYREMARKYLDLYSEVLAE